MEKIERKLNNFQDALETLSSSIDLFEKYGALSVESPDLEHTLLALGMRDSMIQRFEYCTDMLWKMLKVYLEDVEKIPLSTYSPKGIIREAVQAKVISEQEGVECIEMIKRRSETSHIYLQEVAANIAQEIPGFYALMLTIIERIKKNVEGENNV